MKKALTDKTTFQLFAQSLLPLLIVLVRYMKNDEIHS